MRRGFGEWLMIAGGLLWLIAGVAQILLKAEGVGR